MSIPTQTGLSRYTVDVGETTQGLVSLVTIGLTFSLIFFGSFGTSGLAGTLCNFFSLGLSGTFALGAEILIGMVCSVFGTSFLGLIAHVSSLLTAISAFAGAVLFSTSSTSCLLRILYPMKLLLAPFVHSAHT